MTVQLRLQLIEGCLDVPLCARILVDLGDPLFKIYARLDCAEYFVACAEDAVEQAKFLGQQLEYTLVGSIRPIEEVYDDDVVMLLPVAMTASDTLLDPLRVPREVEVDDE